MHNGGGAHRPCLCIMPAFFSLLYQLQAGNSSLPGRKQQPFTLADPDMAGPALVAYRIASKHFPGLLRLLAPRIATLQTFIDARVGIFDDIERKLNSLPAPACRLWVHASSVGEFEQARPVITELKRRIPGLDVVVSFLSDSGYEARKDYRDASAVFYLPLDTPTNARRLADIVKPDLFMLMRYDFWPNHLAAIRRQGAGMVLAAAALPTGSPYFNPLLRGFYRDLFFLFDAIFTVGEEDREAFSQTFGCTNVVAAGDPRFDQVEQRRRQGNARAAKLKPLFAGLTVLVAGSTWAEDEAIVVPAWLPFRTQLSLVLVPHKVDRPNIERLMETLNRQGVTARTTSTIENTAFDARTEVLVVDQIGYLAELYAIASFAWVGGAFGVNVHNTIEPAVHGIPVMFGPNFRKSPEAAGLIASGGAASLSTAEELGAAIGQFVNSPKKLKSAGEKAGGYVSSRLGATKTVSDAMEQMCRDRDR